MTSLTGRYTGSPESKMEFDLARFRAVKNPDGFLATLDGVIEETLTGDLWQATLPTDLATSSPRSPSLFAYISALNLLGAKVLFSELKVSDLIDPSTKSNKSAIERHHLFPKAYLKKMGINDLRDINQIANYALVEWGDNIKISDQSPAEYLLKLKERFNAKELQDMYYWHALPDDWENMDYRDFLVRRRELMAKVIRDGFELLREGAEFKEKQQSLPVEDLVAEGETSEIEFKSTLRTNLHAGEKDSRMEQSCLKTIAGFINKQGGKLIIGVTDDGEPVGIDADKFSNEDKMSLHLTNLIKDKIGIQFMHYIHPRFEDYDGARVLVVECWPGKSPIFVKDGKEERFYLRTGTSTMELTGNQMQEYIKKRFN